MTRKLGINRTARKRPNGSGSIFTTKDGRKRVKVYIDGKAVWRSAKTYEEAQRIQLELNSARQTGAGAPATITVERYAEEWILLKRRDLRQSSIKRYETHLKHIIEHIGPVKLPELKPARVERMYEALLKQGLSASSVNGTHRTLRAMLRTAFRKGVTHFDITLRIDAPSLRKREPRITTKEQIRNVLNEADQDQRYGLLISTLVLTGLRVGEAISARWEDLDLDKGLLTVRDSKTAAGHRNVPITKWLTSRLRRHRAKHLERSLAAGVGEDEHGFIFTNTVGGAMLYQHVRQRGWLPFRQNAGLPADTWIHDLRHAAGSLMLSEGVPLPVVSRVLGHASVAITAQVYAHMLGEDLESVAEKIDTFLAS